MYYSTTSIITDRNLMLYYNTIHNHTADILVLHVS